MWGFRHKRTSRPSFGSSSEIHRVGGVHDMVAVAARTRSLAARSPAQGICVGLFSQ
jgi:hypothetical protein